MWRHGTLLSKSGEEQYKRDNEALDGWLEKYHKDKTGRDDLEAPHGCKAEYLVSSHGADLSDVDSFTTELTGIVDEMKEKLATETRILEGTVVPEYKMLTQNEFSQLQSEEPQWTNVSPNGYLTTDRIPTSEPGSNTSSSFAELFNQDCPIQRLRRKSQPQQTEFSEGTWGGDGCETDATNECSECTVPTINEPTPGTPSEVK